MRQLVLEAAPQGRQDQPGRQDLKVIQVHRDRLARPVQCQGRQDRPGQRDQLVQPGRQVQCQDRREQPGQQGLRGQLEIPEQQVRLGQQGQRERLVLIARFQVQQDHQGLPGRQDHKVRKVILEPQVVCQGRLDRQGQRVLQATQDPQDRLGQQDLKAIRVLPVRCRDRRGRKDRWVPIRRYRDRLGHLGRRVPPGQRVRKATRA